MHEEELIDYLDLMLESVELINKRFSRIFRPKILFSPQTASLSWMPFQ